MRQTALFLFEVVRGLLAIVITLAMAALIIGLLMRSASAEPWPSYEAVKHHPRSHHKWTPPPHVFKYRGTMRHPRYYRRPSCLFAWDMWVATADPYWRMRYLACVL